MALSRVGSIIPDHHMAKLGHLLALNSTGGSSIIISPALYSMQYIQCTVPSLYKSWEKFKLWMGYWI